MTITKIEGFTEDNDLTQADVAKILYITQQQYYKYEKGLSMMGVDKYIKLAEYYNISLDFLVGLTNEPKKLYE